MEIIDQLEGGARGVYSGSIGFISFNDTFDLNIVIRTAVIERIPRSSAPSQHTTTSAPDGTSTSTATSTATSAGCAAGIINDPGAAQGAGVGGRRITIGAGGAIVVQSDPEGEYDEMRLKARALMAAVGICDGSPGSAQVDEHSTAQR